MIWPSPAEQDRRDLAATQLKLVKATELLEAYRRGWKAATHHENTGSERDPERLDDACREIYRLEWELWEL